MLSNKVTDRFSRRHRRKIMLSVRHAARLLGVGLIGLGVTLIPALLGWWDTVTPAAIGIAVLALILFSVVTMLPLELFAYLGLYFDRILELPFPGLRFGRALYRESGRLDVLAREAGLTPLSEFESPDVLDTNDAPIWREPRAALSTVEYLLAHVAPGTAVNRDLAHVRLALRLAEEKGASFYFLVLTLAGMTNAELEARRRGCS